MKRGRETERTSSPVKRPRTDTLPTTPYTPYPLQPSDSPSNPFKRKTNVISLPPISSFRKHIALRFQLYRRGVGFRKGGVHRIVQVPLNYTFTHLRALIAWLFDVPAKRANGKAGKENYLFEVKTNITMEATRSKPGVIKCGETSVKVSYSKDPWRRRLAQDADNHDELEEDRSEEDEDQFGENVNEDSGDWIGADEDDYTLSHVWVTGVQADRGIIYHHHPSTQVHITVNTTKLPRRRGKSNVPYVFSAQGRVHFSLPPLPRPLFTQSILHSLSSSPSRPSRKVIRRLDQKRATISPKPFNSTNDNENRCPISERIFVDDSSDGSQDEEDEDETEAHDLCIDPDHWNEFYYAFGRYLLSFLDPRGRSYAHVGDEYFEEKKAYDPFENDDDDEEGVRSSTPGLTTSSSRGSSLPPSSPPAQVLSSSPAYHHSMTLDCNEGGDDPCPSSIDLWSLSPNSSLELHPSIIASHYPNKKYTSTPAPPIAWRHRLQLQRLERRLERGKKGGYLCERDEDSDEKDELDELDDEDFDDEETGTWIRPVLKEGEVWDPFGDEAEV